MKTLRSFLAALLVALPLLAGAASLYDNPIPKDKLGELINTQVGMCEDGTAMIVDFYDPDATDPEAKIVVYRRGTLVVAVLRASSDKDTEIYVNADQKWYTADAAIQKYGMSACNVPFQTS